MKIPIVYNVRSVLQRPVSTALTALGIALVVAVFIGMLALANGFRTALVRTGSDRNVLVLRRGADSELSSGLSREAASILAAAPHIATGADGKPLVSPEVYVIVPLPKIFDTTQVANVVARGVGDQAWTVRSNVRVLEGHKPETGRSEICVGQRLVARFPHTGIGETMRFAGRDWTVVCHFAAGGSAFESEVWGENEQFMPVFRGQVFQSVTLRLSDPGAFEEAKRRIRDHRRRRRRDRVPVRPAHQRHRDQHHQLGELQRDRLQLPRDAGVALGGIGLRRGDGRAGRVLPRPPGRAGARGSSDSLSRRRSGHSIAGPLTRRARLEKNGAGSSHAKNAPCRTWTRDPK